MRHAAVIALLSSVALLVPATARPAAPCGDTVVSDWADGRIDGRYAPRCYGDALAALPEDVRAYSTATQDIEQALRERIRELRSHSTAERRSATDLGGGAPVPIPLVSAAAVALALALAGAASLVLRRLRRSRLTHRATRPIGQW
jgi:hypothetical protein